MVWRVDFPRFERQRGTSRIHMSIGRGCPKNPNLGTLARDLYKYFIQYRGEGDNPMLAPASCQAKLGVPTPSKNPFSQVRSGKQYPNLQWPWTN